MHIVLVRSTGQRTEIVVAHRQPLLRQLSQHLVSGECLLYDGGRVNASDTLHSLQVANGDMFDVLRSAPRVDNSPLIQHLRREGLNPNLFEYFG